MITIERRQARRLRAVFRRSVFGIGHRGTVPPLVLRAELTQLRAQYRYDALGVVFSQQGTCRPTEAIALPLDALAACEGRDDSPVVLEAAAPDRTVVRWEDRGIPQTREYQVPAIEAAPPFPEPPTDFQPSTAGLLDALADACSVASEDSTRYALNCIQLRSATQEIVATDGRQLLIQGGFPFPFQGEQLLRRSPLFAGKALARDEPLTIGKTDTHVVLKVGPWTLFLEIQKDARFPKVDGILPRPEAESSRLRLDADDARFLLPTLDRLPGGDDANAPATLDLNGEVAIRAKASGQSCVTELVLTRSRYSGEPVRLNTNRAYLARALRLGFAEIGIADARSPVVCRDQRRLYGWQPLSAESAIVSTDDVTRIESASNSLGAALRPVPTSKAKSQMIESTRKSIDAVGSEVPNGTPTTNGKSSATGAGGLAALIQEALALHVALGEARTRTQKLITGLRHHRKQTRLMSTTLSALKQLRLQEAAE